MLEYLALPPIQRGLAALFMAGIAFPLIGVFVVRMNLITMRFMLMHGALLGGALALALGIAPLIGGIAVNLILILCLIMLTRRTELSTGYVVTFFMVLSVALAVIVIYKAGVPAKDALAILWGNIYAVTSGELLIHTLLALAIVLGILVARRPLTAVLFHPEVAASAGIHAERYRRLILLSTGLTIALAMRLVGALLLDSLILLPAVSALLVAGSTAAMFLLSSLFGLSASLIGFTLSLALDIPVSAGVTLTSALIFVMLVGAKRLRRK